MDNREITDEANKKKLQEQKDYSIRKKIIWKGKIAPQGSFYLVVDLKTKTQKITNVILVEKGYSNKQHEEIAEILRSQILKKYGV